MNQIIIGVSVLMVFVVAPLFPFAEGVSISINSEKETFYYGDYLTFTVEVDEITGDLATLYLKDGAGKRSSPIPFPISQMMIVERSPFPFEKVVYPEGKWTVEIEYSGASSSTEFFLKDSGKIVIPVWIKDVGKMWANDLITAQQYATSIEFLIKEGIIMVTQMEKQEPSDEVKIPQWVKTSTIWWTDGKITDQDYAKSLEYLIIAGIIVV